MTTTDVALRATEVDREAVLRHLQLDPRNPATQALLLVCERYGLDPLLKHMLLIQGRPYVTRDGYLHLAHQSGRLDGIEIIAEGEDGDHWWAKVAVYRKDMARPFTYRGRYPKQGAGNAKYGPEMAIKCAEVAALRRAFNVTGIGAADEKWDAEDVHTTTEAEVIDQDAIKALQDRVLALTEEQRVEFLEWKEQHDFPWPWPADVCAAMNTWLDVHPVESEIEAAGADSSEEQQPGETPAAPAVVNGDVEAEARELAGQKCTRCGSSRTNRALSGSGEVVCTDTPGCERRAADMGRS